MYHTTNKFYSKRSYPPWIK